MELKTAQMIRLGLFAIVALLALYGTWAFSDAVCSTPSRKTCTRNITILILVCLAALIFAMTMVINRMSADAGSVVGESFGTADSSIGESLGVADAGVADMGVADSVATNTIVDTIAPAASFEPTPFPRAIR